MNTKAVGSQGRGWLGLALMALFGVFGFSSQASAQCAAVFWMGGNAYVGLYPSGSTFAFTYNDAQNSNFMVAPQSTGTIDLGSTFSSSNTSVARVGSGGIDFFTISGAGTTTITATTTGGCVATATVVVSPKALTITANNATRPYGQANPAFIADYSGLASGDSPTSLTMDPTLSTPATAASLPGTYSITASGASSPNYTISYVAGTLTIAAPAITVSPASLPNATDGVPFSQMLTAGGGIGPYTFSVTAGLLPNGLTLSSDGTLVGTPTTTGVFNFTVTAKDANNFSASQPYSLTVNVPAAPRVAAKSVTTPYNTVASIDLTSSITGAGITAVTVGTAPAHGTVSVSGETVTYTPSSTYYGGSDSFTYTATNPGGTSAPATVSITVGTPAAPTVAAKSISTAYNTAAAIDLSGSITGINITAVTIGTGPTNGTVSVSGETVTYTPASTYYGGSDYFTYTATNPGGTSAPATVSITVGAPAAPTVAAKSISTAYNTAATIDLSGSITGINTTAVTIGTAPTHGAVSVSGQTVTYTPSPTYYGGGDSFTYTATNPGGTSAPATVTITVGAPAAPMATAKSVTTPYNTVANIDLTGSITGTSITAVTIGTAPTHGTVSVSGETVTYTPSSTYYGGSDSFTYTAANPGGTSAPATVTITVGLPAAPTAAAKSVTTPYNTAANVDLSGSITGVAVSAVTIAARPSHGTVVVSGKTVVYTPSATFYGGADSFTYAATNPGGTSAAAQVTLTVTPLAVPVAGALMVSTTTGTSVLVNALAGASGASLTGASVESQPQHGSASANGGQITYTPAAGFVGTDTLTYRVSNRFGQSLPATLTVNVTVAGQAGAASGSTTVTTMPATPVSVDLATLVPGHYVSAVAVGLSPGDAGSAAIGQPTTLTYTSTSAFRGLAQVTAILTTDTGSTVTVTVLVLVSSQPDLSKNPDVAGLVNAQAEAARRFAQNPLDNISRRLESLRDGRGGMFSNMVSVTVDGQSLQGGPRRTGVNGDASHTGLLGNGTNNGTNDGVFGADGFMRSGMGAGETITSDAAGAASAADGAAADVPAPAGRFAFWTGGALNFGSYHDYRQAAGFDRDNLGVNAGVDAALGEHGLLGASVGYSHDSSDIGRDGTRSTASGFNAAVYGSYRPAERVYIDAILGGGNLRFDSRRHAADSAGYLLGHRDGNQWFGSLTTGYDYTRNGFYLSPYARMELSHSTLDAFAESGAAASAVSYGQQTVRTSTGVLGLRLGQQIAQDWGAWTPRARLELGHDFAGTSRVTLGYALVPTAGTYNLLTDPYAANGTSVQVGLGMDAQWTNGFTFSVDYNYLMQPHAHNQQIRFGLMKRF